MVPQRPLLDQERFPWPSPSRNRLGSLLTRPHNNGLRLTTLTQASHTLQTARSLRPAPHPTSRSRMGASLSGTQASPRTGLAPAGHRALVAPTSCGPPFPHNAGAVPAHFVEAEASDSGRAVGRELDLGGTVRAIVGVRRLQLAPTRRSSASNGRQSQTWHCASAARAAARVTSSRGAPMPRMLGSGQKRKWDTPPSSSLTLAPMPI